MRRGTIFVILFIVVVAVVVGLSTFLQAQPPVEIAVAVSPMAERWVSAMAERFNSGDNLVNGTQRVTIRVSVIDDVALWSDTRRTEWTDANRPGAWLPAASWSAAYARERGVMGETRHPSLARTPLVWGGFASRVNALTDQGAQPFDWAAVQAAAAAERWDRVGGESDWQFVKLAFQDPNQAITGIAVLLSGAADYANQAALTGDVTNGQAFREWFAPVVAAVPSFNTLGASPAAALAQRGTSVGDIALLPEQDWLVNLSGLQGRELVVFSYPAYPLVFDFPYVVLSGTTPEAQTAAAGAALFGDFLAQSAQQSTLAAYGLRPADPDASVSGGLFSAAVASGIEARLTLLGEPIAPPPRSDMQRLLQWVSGL